MVVGAVLDFSPVELHAMAMMGAITYQNFHDEPTKASRPFDTRREGFVPAHGGATMVLEEWEAAKKRGAPIYAELIGVEANSDANHLPNPSEDGQSRLMAKLLKQTGIDPTQIDYINAHATSTPLGDLTEMRSIKRVFGDHAKKLRINATKSMLGHTCWAAPVVESVADEVLDEFDTVHAVVCNAGVNLNGLAANMTDDDWKFVIDTNLTGSFYVVRQFLPTLIGNKYGRIILMSSLGRNGVTGQANYAATKAGLCGLSATLSKEYGRRGITSNVVAPGFFDTDMTRQDMSDSNKDFWMKYCPVGRIGDPKEVSSVVLFLASEGASYVNGTVIDVTGGLDWAP
jgi:NAD(P)-dependent dehydrogenase (short-subunit alcohol dehydrogenase family)